MKKKKAKVANDKIPSRLINFLLLGKFEDGNIRQFITTEEEELSIVALLVVMSKNGKSTVLETPICGIDWECSINLIKEKKKK
jgi:hypothetical protein